MVSIVVNEPQQPAPQAGYNLLGQRLGRKGQETRERILVTALRLIEASSKDAPVTLSSVAREAAVGMTTLYLYFPNLGDLVLAVLTRVMDCADSAFVDRLRARWPDDSLEASARGFLRAHYQFWRRHSRSIRQWCVTALRMRAMRGFCNINRCAPRVVACRSSC